MQSEAWLTSSEKLLLKADSDVDAQDAEGRKPIEFARAAGHNACVALIAQALDDSAVEEFMAADGGTEDFAEPSNSDDGEGNETGIPQEDNVHARGFAEAGRRATGSSDQSLGESPSEEFSPSGASRRTSL